MEKPEVSTLLINYINIPKSNLKDMHSNIVIKVEKIHPVPVHKV